jgi:ABC transporter substrate binding protein
LEALAPDIILASTTLATVAMLQTTRTVPIVFVNVADPVGAGFVESLARPGNSSRGERIASGHLWPRNSRKYPGAHVHDLTP